MVFKHQKPRALWLAWTELCCYNSDVGLAFLPNPLAGLRQIAVQGIRNRLKPILTMLLENIVADHLPHVLPQFPQC